MTSRFVYVTIKIMRETCVKLSFAKTCCSLGSHPYFISLTHSLARSPARSLARPLARSPARPPARPLARSLAHSLTHSHTHSLTHSLTHSNTNTCTYKSITIRKIIIIFSLFLLPMLSLRVNNLQLVRCVLFG